MVSAAEPQTFFLPRQELGQLLERLQVDGRQVIGPTIRDGAVMLDPLESVEQLPVGWGIDNTPGHAKLVKRDDARIFDQPPGPSSWKRWTYPPRVTQVEWSDLDESGEEERRVWPAATDVPAQAFLGVRACEIAALAVQDRVLLDGPIVDRDYFARRRRNLIVAVECAVAGGTCFCTSMGTGPELTDGFDLALSEIDDGFVVRVGTAVGEGVLFGLALDEATEAQQAAAAASVARVRQEMGTPLPMEGLPERLMAASRSPRWATVAERCLACTNCTLVCPTCFCTSVFQRSDLDGASASAERSWDSCFTLEFARVAGGNFRTRVADRYRQWLTHKFGSWWPQFGTSGCVGCGRCISWCPVGIDVREETMAVAGPEAVVALPAVAETAPAIAPVARPRISLAPVAASIEGPRTLPWRQALVVETRRETRDVVTLSLRTDDPGLLAGRPGQFVMAGLPAVAAPPISVSRFNPDGLELTIRAAGAATAQLTNLARGDTLSLRGPLGRGWPVELVEGRDVMVITGGIGLAPLRPLLDHMLARRDRIARIHLSYGARTPADRLYVDELDQLASSGVIDVAQTVDRAGPEWLGRVGVVTQVIDRILCACDRTVAFVCGPERMMRATVDVLHERDIPDERIWVTLERHMDCGVGLCGHCQLGRFFVCKDGPVFSLAELGPAFSIEGL